MISTARRIEHATGFLALGLLNEASDEFEAIEGPDRLSPEVMSVRCDLYVAAKNWDLLFAVARELTRSRPADEKGWIHAGIALRKLDRVAEARAVLLEAEPMHRARAFLHYNLGCYHCLLGEMDEARDRVRRACRIDAEFKKAALDDLDLKAIWGEVAP
jgi:tetratricopeptide (TPR) repeat protein